MRADDEKWAKIVPPHTEARERRTKRQSIIAGSIALLIFVGLPVYLVVREQQAKADAHAFCDAAAAGDPIGPVKARAEGLGMNMLRRISDEEVAVGFVGIPPFSRHLCTVRAEGGRVTSAGYVYLD